MLLAEGHLMYYGKADQVCGGFYHSAVGDGCQMFVLRSVRQFAQ